MKRHSAILVAVSVLCLAAFSAGRADAAPITSLPDGRLIPFAAVELKTAGPVVVDGNTTWSSTFAESVFGWTTLYGFTCFPWYDSPPMAALNSSSVGNGPVHTMTFQFTRPVRGVGGLIAWNNFDPPAIIAVYDSSHNLIESTVLGEGGVYYMPPGNFYGFLESSPIISYFTLTDEFIGLRNLTVTSDAAIPEPASILLLGTGLAGLRAWRKRRG